MNRKILFSLVTVSVFAGQAFADDQPRRPGADALRKQILERFDADKDGKLNEEERAKAKSEFENRRAEFAQKRDAGVARDARPNADDARKRFQEVLTKFDKDGDGRLNDEERAAAREAMSGQFNGQREQIMKRFDKDGNGSLDDAEKAAVREHFQSLRGQGHPAARSQDAPAKPHVNREALKQFDADGDGKLNPEERKAAFEAIRAKKASE